MIISYFKTARRVIVRNRLFSLINIIGLAASMSIGLLFMTILRDISRYDQFHEKSDRIVRVTTDYADNRDEVKLATSSIGLADEIRDQIPEAQSVTTVGYGFGGDFRVADKVHPLKGFWAEPSLFEIFSFQLTIGNAATALSKPNSVVITESAATRIFGTTDVVGKSLIKDNFNDQTNPEFVITGVMKDVTKFSHLQFEALGSFGSVEKIVDRADWGNVWSNYTYVAMNDPKDSERLLSGLARISDAHNTPASDNGLSITLDVQPLTSISFFSGSLDNQAGPTMPTRFLWLISGLSIIVLITACFNYTNLSTARASARMREVGVRKVVGARKTQVMFQFIAESTLISLIALVFAFIVFTLIRSQFLNLTPTIGRLFDLSLSPVMILAFIIFAIVVGLMSGLVPGIFFSKVNVISVLRGSGGLRGGKARFKQALIVIQYVFALAFITSTVILYKQYQDFVNFDLGFETNNVINIDLSGNNADVLESKLSQMPEVKEISRSLMVTSIGSNYYTYVKGENPNDSLRSWYNRVDDRYITMFDFRLLAGRNLNRHLAGSAESEAIVNHQLISKLNIGDSEPLKAIGHPVTIDGKQLTIVGVVEDFHHSTLDSKVGPFVFRQLEEPRMLNIKIESSDLSGTMATIERIWKSVDDAHPLKAALYDDQIGQAYRQYSSIGKVVGFLAFLTVVICSLGLLGMVIFSAETRMKEMSIRRVMGARAVNVTYLLSRNFLILLLVSAAIAIPGTWFFFTNVVLSNMVYHSPIGFIELFAGALAVGAIALAMVVSQGLSVAKRNPAEVLRSE